MNGCTILIFMPKLRLPALLVAIVLSSSSYVSVAANPPKPGALCKKVGITQTSNGKKYTCVKVGKKLAWNKGVTIKSTGPVASPKPSASEAAKANDSFAIYGKDADRFRAVDEYGTKLVNSRKKDVVALNSILETPNDPAVIRMTENAQFAFSVYEQFMPLGFVPKWIVGQNGDWVKDKVKDSCPNVAANVQPNAGAASCRLTLVWRAVDQSDDQNARNLMLVQGGHEIFHLYQQELWRNYWAVTPDWMREGAANVAMGIVLTHFDGRKTFAEYGAAQKVERNPREKSSCEAALDKWEKNPTAQGFGFNNGCEYGLGLVMNEYLIMKGFTLKHTLDVVKLVGTGVDFPTAFQQIYKISLSEFYKQLRTYLQTLDYGW